MSAPNYASHPFLGLQIDTGPARQPAYLAYVLAQGSASLTEEGPDLLPLLPGEEPVQRGPSAMNLQMQKVASSQGTACRDLDAVEAMAISEITSKAPTMPRPGDIFEIRRAMTAIAKATRRGMGNVVLMHPATAYEFRAKTMMSPQYSVLTVPSFAPEQSHGWDLFLRSGHSLGDIWTKRTVPEGVALVLYKGSGASDCGYFAFGHWSRPYFLRNDCGIGGAESYARIVKF